jgi:hypothetical protein
MSIPQQSVLGDYETTAKSQQKPRIIRSESGSERERKRQGKGKEKARKRQGKGKEMKKKWKRKEEKCLPLLT